MAAVADPPVDTLISQPRREVMFASRREELTLVHTAEYPVFGPEGRKTGTTIGGIRIQFRDGQLRVPLEGDVVTAQGKRLPAVEVIEWLERHHLFGDQHEGFFRVAQVAPGVSEAEFEAISEAAMLGDVEKLKAILEREEAGWKRTAITNVVTKRLDQLAEFAAQMEAQRVAEEAVKPAAKAKPAKA